MERLTENRFPVGTNRLSKDDPLEIHNDIINIVKLCHSYGENNVYIYPLSHIDLILSNR